jgi:DNA polymerase-3 subunit alpha
MKEIVNKAKSSWLTGPGRGSAAGSLVSYLLGITQVDPIRFDLSFSRFLTMDAIGYPDIDFDVSDPAGLKQLLIQEWGEEKLAFVSNWNMLKFKNLVKDIGKFYDVPFFEVNEMTKASEKEAIEALLENGVDIPKVYSPSYDEIRTHSYSAQKFFRKYNFIEQFIEVLSGQVRDVSTHAGGIIIGDDLTWQMPLIQVKGKYQTPWPEGQNKRMLEPMGFIKFDVLGISTLQVIQRAIEKVLQKNGESSDFGNVKKWYSEHLHPENLDFNDQAVYDYVFRGGHWAGIFQFSQEGAQKFCANADPHSLVDLAIITSIYRPGPLGAGVDKLFLKRKEGENDDEYVIDHPLYNEVTKATYGFIVFQEQISSLVSKLGEGISEDDGQKIRKLLTKKKGGDFDKLQPYIDKFYLGCNNKNIPEDIAIKIWETIKFFSLYGFNFSHALSYSIISFQSAYLSTYYPYLWIEALLDVEYDLKGDGLVQELRKSGYQVSHLSEAGWENANWTCSGGKLLPPTWIINGVSKDFAEKLSEQKFESLIEVWRFFIQEREKKLLSTFVLCGVFDRLLRACSRKGLMDLIGKYKGQIYSQPHLVECIEMMSLGTKEEDDLTLSIKYKDLTGILPVERVYPEEVLREAVSSGLSVPSRIALAPYGRGNHDAKLYLIFVTDIVIKEKWGKLVYLDETGQEIEVYVNNFSVLGQINRMKLYAMKIRRETRTSIKILSQMDI